MPIISSPMPPKMTEDIIQLSQSMPLPQDIGKEYSLFARAIIASGKMTELKPAQNKTTIFWPKNSVVQAWLTKQGIDLNQDNLQNNRLYKYVDTFFMPYSLDDEKLAPWPCGYIFSEKIIQKVGAKHLKSLLHNDLIVRERAYHINDYPYGISSYRFTPLGHMVSCEKWLNDDGYSYIYFLK